MLLLAEQLMILALNHRKGEVNPEHRNLLRFGLPASLIMDLIFQGKAKTQDKKLILINQEDIEDKFLASVYEMLKQEEKDKSIEYYVDFLAINYMKLAELTLETLIDKNIIEKKEKKILWLFPVTKYKFVELDHKVELIHQLQEVLIDDTKECQGIVALIAILDSCNSTDLLLTKGHNKKMEQLISNLVKNQEIRKVVTKLVKMHEEILDTIYALSATYQMNV